MISKEKEAVDSTEGTGESDRLYFPGQMGVLAYMGVAVPKKCACPLSIKSITWFQGIELLRVRGRRN
jgi:hypothetical protein